jgi:hypothetical protein
METTKQTEEFCLGVQMLLKRMDEKPEEFKYCLSNYDDEKGWRNIFYDVRTYIEDGAGNIDAEEDEYKVHTLTKPEVEALWKKYCEIGQGTFSTKVFELITEMDTPKGRRKR